MNTTFDVKDLAKTLRCLYLSEIALLVVIEEIIFGSVYYALRLVMIRTYATYITGLFFALAHGMELSYRGWYNVLLECLWISSLSHMRNDYGWEGAFIAHLVNNVMFMYCML